MKKLLLLLIASVLSVNIYAQDTVNAQDFSENTNPADDIYVWGYNSTTDYKVPMLTLMPFRGINGSLAIVPRYSTWNLHLGTTSTQSTYKLYTVGKGYFSDLVRAPSLYLGASSYISYSGDDLIFYDPNTGQKTLTEIITGASSIYPGSGIEKTGNTLRWDGVLTEGAVIYTGTNNVYIGDGGDKYLAIYGNGNAYLYADGILGLKGTTSFKIESDSASFEYNATTNKLIITDNRSTPMGLEYDQNIDNTDSTNAIPCVGGVNTLIAAAVGSNGDSTWVRINTDTTYIGLNKMYSATTSMQFEPYNVTGHEGTIYGNNFGGTYNTIFKAVMHEYIPIDATPSGNVEGMKYYDDSEDMFKYYNGSKWCTLDTVGGGIGGTYDSATVAQSDPKYTIVYNDDLTKWDSVELEVDTSESVYVRYLTSDFDKTVTDSSYVSDLTMYLEASETYKFEIDLHISADATGGIKIYMNGTATSTNLIGTYVLTNVSGAALAATSRLTAFGWGDSRSAATSYYATITGSITTNTAGTLGIQFGQNVASGTSTIEAGSSLKLIKLE